MIKIIQVIAFIGIMILSNFTITAQIGSNLTPVRPASPGFQLGWDGSGGHSGSLEISNNFNDVINFSTNTNPHAKLDANGNFSIGQTSPTNYFGIGSFAILWHNNITSNIYVGKGAGNSNNGGLNVGNTYVGNDAGHFGYSTQIDPPITRQIDPPKLSASFDCFFAVSLFYKFKFF